MDNEPSNIAKTQDLNMTHFSLKDFVLTGNFGPVKIGMHKTEVIEILGEPDADSNFGGGSAGLLYSWYEFFYDTKTKLIHAIQNDHLFNTGQYHKEAIEWQNERIKLDLWFLKPTQNISRKAVEVHLMAEKISYRKELLIESEILRFDSGVYLDFLEEEDGIHRETDPLNGIRYFPVLEGKLKI